ncbi:MAG: hypothetical protein HKN67_03645, partial [Saprospiraceae bacterium]|nr:hypothetical protein [Saprospiraceae bacterium]
SGPASDLSILPLMFRGFPHGGGCTILVGGDPGDLIHGMYFGPEWWFTGLITMLFARIEWSKLTACMLQEERNQ